MRTDTTRTTTRDDAAQPARSPDALAEIADLRALLNSAFDAKVPAYDVMALANFRNR